MPKINKKSQKKDPELESALKDMLRDLFIQILNEDEEAQEYQLPKAASKGKKK